MTLYHGSENIIEAPEFGKGARNNDYGKGFYCTENIELARELSKNFKDRNEIKKEYNENYKFNEYIKER